MSAEWDCRQIESVWANGLGNLAACGANQLRRTICCSRWPSSLSRRARTGSAITPSATRPAIQDRCGSNHRGMPADPVNIRGHRTRCGMIVANFAASISLVTTMLPIPPP
jgi:hypothetical protein